MFEMKHALCFHLDSGSQHFLANRAKTRINYSNTQNFIRNVQKHWIHNKTLQMS